jgi:hypothetical protein
LTEKLLQEVPKAIVTDTGAGYNSVPYYLLEGGRGKGERAGERKGERGERREGGREMYKNSSIVFGKFHCWVSIFITARSVWE